MCLFGSIRSFTADVNQPGSSGFKPAFHIITHEKEAMQETFSKAIQETFKETFQLNLEIDG